MKISRIIVILAIAATLMACSLTVNVPSVKTGVTQTFTIDEPLGPSSETALVNIEMGAGKLDLKGGSSKLIEGDILYNVDEWKPVLTHEGNTVTIKQENTSNIGIPEGTIKNIWNLKLGTIPVELNLATGAYDGNLDLSGVPLTKLTIADGASRSRIWFDSPNPVDMSLLSYKTGASDVVLSGLSNSNVDMISFNGGVGSFELDFSGELRKDVNVTLRSGMSEVKLIFPTDKHVKVVLNGGLSNVDIYGTWSVTNNVYEFGSTGPLINVVVDMAVGNLQLIQE